ncbi:choice-of-anchor A family protein [Bifidobacterium sp. SO1]|uniref:choice-of-anchor A family protein n=1 Tax=Bifidobacterium sp. SO1 TaxID=2809029 RepID=UPI001BDCDFE2|nr:choice-of-anchor A family protein [Bifidobacterium sp. SO1]MBT1161801.1 choice-of-anchor A family protein [Bifidobacterium sp. SO1]
MYIGGNLTSTIGEAEGINVVNGDATIRPLRSMGGNVWWGMREVPPLDADVFTVGGDLNARLISDANGNLLDGGNCANTFSSAGSIKIGGKVQDGYRIVKPDQLYRDIDCDGNTDDAQAVYYNDRTRDPRIGIGRTEALKVNVGGGRIVDMNGFDRKITAWSDTIRGLSDTGTVSYSTGEDTIIRNIGVEPAGASRTITRNGRVTFHGSGKGAYQKFTLDATALNAQAAAHQWLTWSFAFDGIPDNTPIYVDLQGSDITITPSQGFYLNGEYVGVNTNEDQAGISRFRRLADRLVWNMHDTDRFLLQDPDRIPGAVTGSGVWTRWAMNFPGSILSRKGDLTIEVDTNGRFYANGNVSYDTNERHNTDFKAGGMIGLNALKTLAANGRTDITPADFTVGLYSNATGTGTALQSKRFAKQSDGSWKAAFDPIPVGLSMWDETSHTYEYSVREIPDGSLRGVSYDTHTGVWRVTVTANLGVPTVRIEENADHPPVFRNTLHADAGSLPATGGRPWWLRPPIRFQSRSS